ncbi:hypothetical protein ASF57_23165 [Methylobacterium sp. Leaf117]|nr:hypothetical protein ASF57_23165 [Methylobacterium sp. Leaf117]
MHDGLRALISLLFGEPKRFEAECLILRGLLGRIVIGSRLASCTSPFQMLGGLRLTPILCAAIVVRHGALAL